MSNSEFSNRILLLFLTMLAVDIRAETSSLILGDEPNQQAASPLAVSILLDDTLRILEGETLVIHADVSGAVGRTKYRWRTPAGEVETRTPSLVYPLVSSYDDGNYTLTVQDADSVVSASVDVIVDPRPAEQPADIVSVIPAGETVHLRTASVGQPSRSWSWFYNGNPIPEGSLGIYTISNVSFDKVGKYELVQFSPSETLYSVTLSIAESRLTNMSVRSNLNAENPSATLGFVTTGQPHSASPPSTLLLRAIGPTLKTYGVLNPLPDPNLEIFSLSNVNNEPVLTLTNDNWTDDVEGMSGGKATLGLMAGLGAFTLNHDSRDSAIVLYQSQGSINTMVCKRSSDSGIVLNEIYSSESSLLTLSNMSLLTKTGTGENVVIAGFVISGQWPLEILIRGVGPGLEMHGVHDYAINPKLNLFDSDGQLLHNNDNWGQATNAEAIVQKSVRVGAFPLLEGSNDAVILETLSPGAYTVHLETVGNETGMGLIEIYAVR